MADYTCLRQITHVIGCGGSSSCDMAGDEFLNYCCLAFIAEEDELDGGITHLAEHASEAGGSSNTVPLLTNADPAVLEALRGSYKVLVGRHSPTVLEWLKVAVKVITKLPCSRILCL
jgi:hypothetical protein